MNGNSAIKLSNATLADLPSGVSTPNYDRSALTPGIVHIGLGNFHRGHQAWYLHTLMQQGLAHDWAILGAGVRAGDARMRERLLAQDCLTTLVELDPDSASVEVIGSMIDFIEIDAANGPLIAAMSDPQIRIVSLTVTEGGYYQDETGAFDLDHPDIQHDIANPQAPMTAFGAMIVAYRVRRDAGHAPFTGQSCDNVQGNGAVLRQTVVGLAEQTDPELAQWINTHASFPDAMVDCIVPATGEAELAFVKEVGIDDAAPVTHENYRQWVIEDDFCSGRPPWEMAGATLTNDVHPFESMKIRILNAGHQVLANAGEILGIETISGCMAEPLIAGLFNKVQTEEFLPYVVAPATISKAEYLALIERRFANAKIRDTTRRVAFDGSSRHPGFILPIVRAALAAGGSVDGLALVEALWARMCFGVREDGSEIAANDPDWATLHANATAARENPDAWLAHSSVYGDLATQEPFRAAFDKWMRLIKETDTRTALQTYIDS